MTGRVHHPDRSSWDCLACDQPWPCDPERERLVAATPDRVQLTMVMADEMFLAALTLPAEPIGALYERFMAWALPPLRSLGIGRARVYQITQNRSFPLPIAQLEMGNVWLASEVEDRIREHRPNLAEPTEGDRDT